jgi:hypothetical protein
MESHTTCISASGLNQTNRAPLDSNGRTARLGTLLQAAQAVLTVPALSYYFQANLGLYVLGAVASDIWYRVIWSDPLGRGSDHHGHNQLPPETTSEPKRQQSSL